MPARLLFAHATRPAPACLPRRISLPAARLAAFLGLVACAAALNAAAPAAPASAPGTAAQPAPPSPKLPEAAAAASPDHASAKPYLGDLPLVPSVFDDSFKSGKDPFFPNTERGRGGGQTNDVEVLELSDLALKGLVVSASKRLAIINRYTLAEGETRTIRVDDRTYEVQCIEIREKSAVIGVRKQKRELFLPPGHGS